MANRAVQIFTDVRMQGGFGVDGGISVDIGNDLGRAVADGSLQIGQTIAPANYKDTTADYNNDDALDFVGIFSNDYFTVSLGNGAFKAPISTQLPVAGSTPNDTISKDFDKDGYIDIVLLQDTNTTGGLFFRGNGHGTFRAGQNIGITTTGNREGAAADDLNGDGNLDLIARQTTVVPVTLGNGNGTFRAPRSFGTFVKYAVLTAT